MHKLKKMLKISSAFALPAILFLTGAPAARAVTLNITYDSSVSSAPSGFKNAINYVAQTFDSYFTNPIDININVGWGEVNGQALSANAVGESISNYYANVSYAAVAQDLYNTDSAASNSTTAHTAAQYIPATSPIKTSLWITSAEAKAIGGAANSTATDGYVGFDSSYNYSFNTSGATPAGTYDFVGLAMHEISEVMGRTGFLASSTTAGAYNQTPLDLFRYSSAGTLDTSSPGSANYFSVNGGATSLNTFNTVSGADYSDWAGSTADAFNAFIGSAGTTQPFTVSDLSVLNAIGYQTSNTTYSTVASLAGASSSSSNAVPAPLASMLLALGVLASLLGLTDRRPIAYD